MRLDRILDACKVFVAPDLGHGGQHLVAEVSMDKRRHDERNEARWRRLPGRHEPPSTEPYVRWCERAAGGSPPPTRFDERQRPGLKIFAVVLETLQITVVSGLFDVHRPQSQHWRGLWAIDECPRFEL